MKCPLCNEKAEIKESKKGKPFLRCDACGTIMFCYKDASIEMLRKEAKKRDSYKEEKWF